MAKKRRIEKQFIKVQPYWDFYKGQTGLSWIMLSMCDDLTVGSSWKLDEVPNVVKDAIT